MTVKVHDAVLHPGQDSEKTLLNGLGSSDPWVVEDAACGLGKVGSKASVEPLITLLKNPQATPRMRQCAGSSLGLLGDPLAIEPMIRALENAGDPDERYGLVTGLGHFNDPRVKGVLEHLQKDNDVMVARAAKSALINMK